MAFKTYDEAVKFLFSFTNYERVVNFPYDASKLNLRRMTDMLEFLGEPHLAMRAVHITGTKGKGSTSLMTASILRQAGLTVGAYTSPHLVHLEERIAVNGGMIPREDLLRQVNILLPHLEKCAKSAEQFATPTFFEIFTGMAWNYFREKKVDVAVMEVGLGGRLDSTNVIRPDVCIITNVTLDHMRQLGDTLTAIAAEKAGIVKPGVPVLSAVTDAGALKIIEEKCRELNASLYLLGREITLEAKDGTFSVEIGGRKVAGLRLRQPGEHQRWNAALAVSAALLMSRRLPGVTEEAIRAGLESVELPGRIEVVRREPTIINDGAHNVASLKCLFDTIGAAEQYGAMRLVFAVADDKDIEGMAAHVASRAAELRLRSITLTRTHSPRACARERLTAIFEEAFRKADTEMKIEWNEDASAIYADALKSPADELTVFTGSMYLAGQILEKGTKGV